MAVGSSAPRTRRALLGAALGAAVATVASALGRPSPARAGTDGDVVLGESNAATDTTRILNTTNAATVFESHSGGGTAVQATSDDGVAINGFSASSMGVYATTGASAAAAVTGQTWGHSAGVYGYSGALNQSLPAAPTKTGVYGRATQDTNAAGVRGESTAGYGVYGASTIGGGTGWLGYGGWGAGGSGDLAGVAGTSVDGDGVQGTSESGAGVFGISTNTIGVSGRCDLGVGVQGVSDVGVGVRGTSGSGFAIRGSGVSGVGVRGDSTSSTGVLGVSKDGIGVVASSASSYGIFGSSSSAGLPAIAGHSAGRGTGILGYSDQGGSSPPAAPSDTGVCGQALGYAASNGVRGLSDVGVGVRGQSTSGPGVHGESQSGAGVEGFSSSGRGAYGFSASAAGVLGVGVSGTGLLGYSGSASPPAALTKTGVYGYAAQDAAATGVRGSSTAGFGVRGSATTGTAGYFSTPKPVDKPYSGYALRAIGRVRLDQCAGIATIPAGAISYVVTPGIDLVSTSAVVATLQGKPSGSTPPGGTAVSSVSVDTANDRFTIYLKTKATATVKVAWHVFG